MRVDLYSLYGRPAICLFARHSRKITLVLSTGKEVFLSKESGDCDGKLRYEGDLSERDTDELFDALQVLEW